MKVASILDVKGKKGTVSISPDASLMDAARLLCEHNIGALLVRGSEGGPAGIISERDIIRECASGATLGDVKVGDVMTKDMLVVTPQDSLDAASGIMARHHIRHLPVVDGGEVVGMVTVRDVVEALDEEKDIHIRRLGDVAGGTYGSDVF